VLEDSARDSLCLPAQPVRAQRVNMFSLTWLLAVITTLSVASAHTVITYPGWRGNNLHTNGTAPEDNPGSRGIDYNEEGDPSFPWGMQWMYPCGGMPQTTNRTKWPVNGGAISVQPGWFPGHSSAYIYINIGINEPGHVAPRNMSHPVHPVMAITGPSNNEYPGQFCIPQIGMPAHLDLKVGDNITIQVIETAQHGAALYSCVDVTLAEPEEVEEVTQSNCYNSSAFGFNLVFTTASLEGAASATVPLSSAAMLLTLSALLMVGSAWI